MSHPRLSIVVPATTAGRPSPGSIESLVHQTAHPSDFELIVVDDGSTESEPRNGWLVKDCPMSFTSFHSPRTGDVRAPGMQGVEQADATLILFLDADMLCGPAVVEKHLSAHEQTPDRAVVGRVLTHPSIRRTPLARWFDLKNPSSHLGALRPTHFVTQNLSIPASLLSNVGGFDERFSEYPT